MKMEDTFPSPPTPPIKGYKQQRQPRPPPLDTHGLLDDKSRGERIKEFISRGTSPIPWLSRPSSPVPAVQRANRKSGRAGESAVERKSSVQLSNTYLGTTTEAVDLEPRGEIKGQVDGGRLERTATKAEGASTASSFFEPPEGLDRPLQPMFKVLPLLPLDHPEDWRKDGNDSTSDWATGLC